MTEINHVGHIPPNQHLFYFDPSKDLPCRLLFANEKGVCLVRFLFNHLCLDFTSTEMIIEELFRSNDPMVQDNYSNTDVAILVEKKLQEDREKLREFWKRFTPNEQLPSMNWDKQNLELDPTCFDYTKVCVEADTVNNLKFFLRSHNIRLFDFITSLYQILFHVILKQNVICMFTDVDMRIHFPELDKTVGKFTQAVPLIIKIDENFKVIEFIKRNKELHLRVMEHSLLPIGEILELNGQSNLNQAAVFAHSIIMGDKSQRKILQKSKENAITVKRIVTGDYTHETGFFVYYDIEGTGNSVELELFYSTKSLDKHRSLILLKALTTFITAAVNNPNMRIKELGHLIKDGFNIRALLEEGTSVGDNRTDTDSGGKNKSFWTK